MTVEMNTPISGTWRCMCAAFGGAQEAEAQKKQLEKWTCYPGYSPLVWYADVSDHHHLLDRPHWNRLERAMREGKVSKLVVASLDRLGKSAGEVTDLFEALKLWGVTFESVSELLRVGVRRRRVTPRMS